MMFAGLASLGQEATAKAILDEALAKIEHATTLSMTVVETTEEFPRASRTKCAYRRGGFLRLDNRRAVQVASPESAWEYSTSGKTYESLPTLPKDLNAAQALWWLRVFAANLPILSGPTPVTWHALDALRLELDGRKEMTKEAKLFVYFDPATHLPLGVSANLGSITQVKIFEHLQLDVKLRDSLFAFVPPPGWKQRKIPNS